MDTKLQVALNDFCSIYPESKMAEYLTQPLDDKRLTNIAYFEYKFNSRITKSNIIDEFKSCNKDCCEDMAAEIISKLSGIRYVINNLDKLDLLK